MISVDPKTQKLGENLLRDAGRLKMTNGELMQALVWMLLFVAEDGCKGGMAKACASIRQIVDGSIKVIEGRTKESHG